MVTVAIIASVILAWSAFSRPLDRRGITSALVFTAAGFVAARTLLGLIDVTLESAVAERVAEVTLVLLLFSDAARLDLGALRHELGWPSRLLLIGLPLTMLAGFGVGVLASPAWRSPRCSCSRRCSARPTRRSASASSPTRRCRRACARRWTWRAASTTASPCPSSSSRSTSPTPSSRRGSRAVASNAAEQIGWGLLPAWSPACWAACSCGSPASARLDRQRVAADPPARRRALGLRHRTGARRQRLHRRLRGRHRVRPLRREQGRGVDSVHRRGGWRARGGHLDRLRRRRYRLGHPPPHLAGRALRGTQPHNRAHGAGRGSLLGKVRAPTVAFIGWFGPRGLASVVFALIVMNEACPRGRSS